MFDPIGDNPSDPESELQPTNDDSKIDTVIFDLFDTLIHLKRDTNPYLQLCRAVGATRRIRESLVVDAPTLGEFCDHLGVTRPMNLPDIQHDLNSDIDNAALFHDTMPTLQKIRDAGLRVGIISNLASPYKRAVTRLKLDQNVDALIYSCDLGIAKPAPDIYRAALSELGSSASSTLMIGDSQRADVEGPNKCGIRAFLLDRRRISSDDSVLKSLADVDVHLSF